MKKTGTLIFLLAAAGVFLLLTLSERKVSEEKNDVNLEIKKPVSTVTNGASVEESVELRATSKSVLDVIRECPSDRVSVTLPSDMEMFIREVFEDNADDIETEIYWKNIHFSLEDGHKQILHLRKADAEKYEVLLFEEDGNLQKPVVIADADKYMGSQDAIARFVKGKISYKSEVVSVHTDEIDVTINDGQDGVIDFRIFAFGRNLDCEKFAEDSYSCRCGH